MADHPRNPSDTLPDYVLEQYALGELPAAEAADLDRRVAGDETLRRRLEDLRASNDQILARYPADRFAAAVAQRIAAQRGRPAIVPLDPPRASRRWLVAAPVLAAAAVVLLLLVRPDQGRVAPAEFLPPPVSETTRAKGDGAYLCLYRHVGDRVETLADGQSAQQGDILQLSYVPMGRLHGVIVSIDGRRATTLHFPPAAGSSTRLRETGETLLAQAYELDDAPDFERFFLVTARGPIDVEMVMAAARLLAQSREGARAERMMLPDTLEQTSLLVPKKESR